MDISKLLTVLPKSVYDELPAIIEKYSIDSGLVLAHFISQCSHESADFSVKVENLNYSKAGLLKIFPKYFDEKTALQYERQSIKIANRVYANRMGNGDEASGEGFKFRGRGYIQLTGKSNYVSFNSCVPEILIDNPDLVSQKYPLLSAGWFFHKNNLFELAKGGEGHETILALTKRINGGTHGIDDRMKKFDKYFNLFK